MKQKGVRRIVVLTMQPPTPFGNPAARWYYVLLKGLAERGHRVQAFTCSDSATERDSALELFRGSGVELHAFPHRQDTWLKGKWRTLVQPFSYMFSDELVAALKAALAAEPDVFHIEQLWSGWCGGWRPERTLLNVHHLQMIDLELAPMATMRNAAERQLIETTERRLLRRFLHVRTCSPRLEGTIRALNPRAEVATVPVGIDTGLYRFTPDSERTREPRLFLIGQMHWYPSLSAAVRLIERIWPEVRAKRPDAKLVIVGRSARRALASYAGRADIEIHEDVPDIAPYFAEAGVMIYPPQRGSGMKIKVLEAMAYGVPVVTTSEGVEGLPAEDGVHAALAEDDPGLVARTLALLESRAMQDRLRHAARALIERHCGPGPTVDAIDDWHDRLIHNAAARGMAS